MRDEPYRVWSKAVETPKRTFYHQIKLTVKGRVYTRTGANWLRRYEWDDMPFRDKLKEVGEYATRHGYTKV